MTVTAVHQFGRLSMSRTILPVIRSAPPTQPIAAPTNMTPMQSPVSTANVQTRSVHGVPSQIATWPGHGINQKSRCSHSAEIRNTRPSASRTSLRDRGNVPPCSTTTFEFHPGKERQRRWPAGTINNLMQPRKTRLVRAKRAKFGRTQPPALNARSRRLLPASSLNRADPDRDDDT
jgi:hypothetical protein